MKYGKIRKKVTFQETDKRHADLKIRLNHDGIKQQQFFSLLITGYLEKDPDLMQFIFNLKERLKIQTKGKRKMVKKLYEKGLDNMEKVGLTYTEKESIYDLIEFEGDTK
jgi:hypothetical protein